MRQSLEALWLNSSVFLTLVVGVLVGMMIRVVRRDK
jgi:hypothetical protein